MAIEQTPLDPSFEGTKLAEDIALVRSRIDEDDNVLLYDRLEDIDDADRAVMHAIVRLTEGFVRSLNSWKDDA